MSYSDHDPDAHENEPWWFYLWCIWGLVCATIIFAVDGHLAASLIWLGTAVLVGRFGMPVFSKLGDAVFIFQHWRCKAAHDAEDEQAVQAGDSFSLVGWGARRQLDILDPARKPWDLYGSHLLVGVFHGLLLGPILCSLSPILEGPTDTALGGALLGVVLGPIALCLFIAIAFPLELIFSSPGPSIDDIRPTVNSATVIL